MFYQIYTNKMYFNVLNWTTKSDFYRVNAMLFNTIFFQFCFDLLKWILFLNKYFDWGFQVHDIPLNQLCGFSLFMYVKSILHDIEYSPLSKIHFCWLCSCHKNQMKWKMHFIGKRKIYCSTHCKRAKDF